jgi:hypothetical protein
MEVPAIRRLTATEQSPGMEGRRIRLVLESSRPKSRRLASTRRSVRDKFHLHDFNHIGEKLLDMGKQPSGGISKPLIKPVDIPEFIEDLPDVLPLAKKNIHEASGADEAERA